MDVKWQRLLILLLFAIAMAVSVSYSLHNHDSNWWRSAIVEAIPYLLIAMAFEFLLEVRDAFVALHRRFGEDLKRQEQDSDKLSIALTQSLDSAGGLQLVRKVLSQYPSRHHSVVIQLVQRHPHNRLQRVENVSVTEFYGILEDALKRTTRWDGVHEGSIATLCEDPQDSARNEYLSSLARHTRAEKRRGVVLADSEFDSTLSDRGLIDRFLQSGGRDVASFAIRKSALIQRIRAGGSGGLEAFDQLKLHDCALHDKGLLLHFNRDAGQVTFEHRDGDRARTVREIFEALNQWISAGRPAGGFVEIK